MCRFWQALYVKLGEKNICICQYGNLKIRLNDLENISMSDIGKNLILFILWKNKTVAVSLAVAHLFQHRQQSTSDAAFFG